MPTIWIPSTLLRSGRRYLIRFDEDTLQSRPLWIRLIIEFLATFILVTVAAEAGVINHYVGGGPISRTARPVGIVEGRPEGGYTDAFELICCDCGDDPDRDYRGSHPGCN